MIMEDAFPEWVGNIGYFKEFNPTHVHFSVGFMSTLPKSIVGLQNFTVNLQRLNPTMRMQHLQQRLLGGWRRLGWTTLLEEVAKLNSIWFLENLINFSLTWLVGGGQSLHFFCLLSQRREEVDHKASSP